MTWILHASDPHLGVVSPGQELDDSKLDIARDDIETTQTVFRQTLESLSSHVTANGKPSAVVISGDLTYRNTSEGFLAFSELLTERADLLPEDPARVVVVPGNHDVDWSTSAGTPERYEAFLGATRDQGCATPLLDGVDFNNTGPLALEAGTEKIPHVVDDPDFLIVPLNSSNYCGTIPRVRAEGAWTLTEWKKRLASLGVGAGEARRQVEALMRHDVARVSRRQVRALRLLLEELKISVTRGDDPRPRICVLHHQLLPVSASEEWKTFESLVNLGFVREAFQEFGIDVVLHGHKHEENVYWDFARRGNDPVTQPLRRTLVIASPGHFRPNQPVLRALELEGTPLARNLKVTTFNGVEAYSAAPLVGQEVVLPTWLGQMESESGEQVVIRGRTAHETYARIRAHFDRTLSARLENLVCEIDTQEGADTLPPDYPDVAQADKQKWFTELIDWWQLRNSRLVRERVRPFNHGERIREHWGDQVERAARLLNERADSSRGMAILVGPEETGRTEGDPRPIDEGTYPAFVVAEFGLTRRGDRLELDCFGYFRKQEMNYWWPVNVAELARLQEKVLKRLKRDYRARTGRIVTFSALALYGTDLPQVAVTEIDRAIEDEGRIWRLAAAVTYPTSKGAPDAAADWEKILAELAGVGRVHPPVPVLGAEVLLDEVKRFAALDRSARKPAAVARRLEDLCKVYRPMQGRDVGQQEEDLILPAVRKLEKAVGAALERDQ
jgi:Calcineurin-like phosphoesterase